LLSLVQVSSLASIIVVVLLTGCSRTVRLALPANRPVHVIADSHEQIIAPSDSRYRELQQWLAKNQKGWSPVFATNPSGGVLVTAGDLWLQFFHTTVFTRTREGLLQKKVHPHENGFLQLRSI
jgi:hypothetical protein